MDDDMVRAWNDRVRPNDKVYHLGDVVINRKALPTLARLGCGPLPEKRKRKNFQDAHAKGNPDIDNAVVKKYN
jgi:calcineurin-like phosphoesterase family protein